MAESGEETRLVENTPTQVVEEKTTSNLDLISILGELLGVESKVNELKLELKLKDSNLEFIRFMLDNFPECIKEISTNLNLVLEDGKLDVSDVPILINMVKGIINNRSNEIHINKNKNSLYWESRFFFQK